MLLAIRLILLGVFAVAAAAKLVNVGGTRESLVKFGLAERLAGPGSYLLPIAELTLAALLVFTATARGAALGALVMLVAFSVAIGVALARGREPDCNCFGELGRSKAGWPALGRNAALAAAAVAVAVAGPGESIGHALRGADAAVVVAVSGLIVILMAQAWFSYELFRQNGRLLDRVRALEENGGTQRSRSRGRPGLMVGEPAPAFELLDLDGGRRTLDELLARRLPLALAFSDPDCAGCESLMPQLARLSAARAGELEVALITRGSSAENRAKFGAGELPAVLLQHEREVMEQYRVWSVPSATIIGPDGLIASGLAIGELAIEDLLNATAKSPRDLMQVVGG